jgi:uncharacterized protein YfaS (alpha-2-macroglobulin family)
LIRSWKWWQFAVGGVVAAGIVVGAIAYRARRAAAEEGVFSFAEGAAKAELSPAPEEPGVGPAEKPTGDLGITYHRPTDESPYHVQIQVGFDQPLVPLTDVSDPQRLEALSHFTIEPKPAGAFRLVGVQAVVFSPESPFPPATEYTVTVRAGLKDVHGRALKKDFAWEFHTEPLEVSFGYGNRTGLPLDPTFTLTSNGALNVESLRQHLECAEMPGGNTQGIEAAWQVTAAKGNPPVIQEVTEYRRNYSYELKPDKQLRKHTSYRLTVAAGVTPEVGNRPTGGPTTLDFSTYGPLAFTLRTSGCGRRLQNEYWLSPSNSLQEETLKGAITLSPPVKGQTTWSSPYSTPLHLPDLLLKPDTDYTVTISEKVRDVFGQGLAKPCVLKFRTSHLRPRIDVLGDIRLLAPRTDPVLPYRAVNPRVLKTRLLPLTLAQFLDWAFSIRADDCAGVLGLHDSLTRKSAEPYKQNAEALRDLRLGKLMRSGRGLVLYELATTEKDTCADPPRVVTRDGAILRTNLGLQAQLLPAEMRVWATHLTDGSPAAGCEVVAYRYARETGSYYKDRKERGKDSEKNRELAFPKPKQLFSGKTDKDGRLRIPAAKLLESEKPESRYLRGASGLVVVVREGDDFAYLTDRWWLGTQLSLWSYDARTGWDGPQLISLGSIFSDRDLYQPGEDVKLKGVVRYRTEDRLVVPRQTKLKVSLSDPRGATTPLGSVTTDDYGTFSLTVKPKPGDPLGYYSVTASSEKTSLTVTGSFRRADFRPPRYKAQLTTDKKLYLVGEKIRAQAQGDYLFGAPLAGGEGTFRVNTEPGEFRPEGWNEFRFAVPEWIRYYAEDRESSEKSLVEKALTLDDRGRAGLEVPVVADDVPEPMVYSLEAEVKDVSGQSVGADLTVTALPYGQLTGVRVKQSFVAAKKPCGGEVVVTDPQGKPLPGVKLNLELTSLKWVFKKVQHDGYEEEDYVLETKVVHTQPVTSGEKPVAVEVTPPEAGEYLLVARFAGRKPTGTEGAGWLYVSGEGAVSYRQDADEKTKVELRTNREDYKVGDEVLVAVPSPFKRARAAFSVEREKVFSQQFQEVGEGITTFRFRVTKEMIPNVFAQVSLTELGPRAGNLFSERDHVPYRLGFAEVKVSRAPHRLEVKVSPRDPKRRPGETAVLNFHVDDAASKPATVQLTVMVVDEAILQLTGYRPPDLVKRVLEDRALSLSLLDNRPLVVHTGKKLPSPPKGWGYGNGGGGGAIVAARLRKDFVHLAYFDPDLRTDGKGNARCEFKVPDNLTTWRALVVAVSRENDFGSGDATFVVNQPLMLQGLLPRFARVDDEITTGVAINNQTGAKGKAKVTCRVTKGDALLKANGVAGEQTLDIADNRTGAVRFPKSAVGVGDCVLQFGCELEGTDENGKPVSAADRLELPLVVQEPGYWEAVTVMREARDRFELPVKITDAIRTDLGEVKVSLTSTAFGNLAPDAEWLVQYPYGCAEQLSSRLIGLLAIEEPAKRFRLSIRSEKPLKQLIEEDLAGLLECQRSDGGFGYWPDADYYDESGGNPWLSTHVALALASAREHGYEVPKRVMDRLVAFLKKATFGGGPDENWPLHYRVIQAVALKALGTDFTQHYGELMTKRKALPLIDWVRLDGLLQRRPQWQKQADDLYTDIKKREWITERGAHLEEWKDAARWWWSYMDTSLSLAAAGLKLDLQVQPTDERVAKTANYLVNTRKHLQWRSTYDTAQMLDALCRYVEVREATKPSFTARVGMDGGKQRELRFEGYKLGQQEHRISLSSLKEGAHQLRVEKDGRGTLYATMELRYVPKGERPPQSQGFFIQREMTNLRTKKPVASASDELRVGDVVRVKLTLNAPQDAYNVAVESPVPAGLEPVDTSFKTTPASAREAESSGGKRDWWRPNPFDHREFHRDHIALFAQDFPAGVYEYEYLLQATNPGSFTYPPARIYRMYEPEEFGATRSEKVKVGAL